MHRIDYRDLFAGLLLIAAGLFVGIYASTHYGIGTVTRMGPGMFPAVLGYTLAALGVLVLIPAFLRSGRRIEFDLRPFVAVLAAVLVFALTVNYIGLVPSVFLLSVVAIRADNRLGLVGTLVLSSFLSALALLVFHYGLSVALEPFIWPFS